MKVIDNLNEFIEKIDAAKKVNPLDLSSDQDLTIAIMNLISIEEHLFFSGAKTQDRSFYDLIESIRECRKELLGRIIKSYRGEVWCISKHLLASCMRLSEVATKALHADKKEEAYDLFDRAYNLYCLFWGLNLEAIDESEARKLIATVDKNTSEIIDKTIDTVANGQNLTMDMEMPIVKSTATSNDSVKSDKDNDSEKTGFTKSLKNFVTKAINCCRE